MSTPANGTPTVAHFRRIWFKATETFLYTTVANQRRTRPLLIGYERAHAAEFPVSCPVVSLYPPGSRAAAWRRLRRRLLGANGEPHFASRRTRRALSRWQARVLHAHFGYTGHRLLPVRRRSGLPLVTSFYGEDASRLPDDPVWQRRYTELFEEGDRFLVEGPAMRQRLIRIGCPSQKLVIQRIAIEPDRYPFRERAPRPRSEPVRLFFCASFREKKGLLPALEAVARARERHPNLVFRIAGDGPERPRVEEALDRLGLHGCATLLGFVTHDRMIREMQDADLFLQPSVTAADGDSEGGAPTTLLEAQACGLPVLATQHADIPYVVAEGESALLAPERDVDALFKNLLVLLEEPERWAPMGSAGRVRVEHLHDALVEVPRLEQLYLELAKEAPCSPS